MTEKATWRKVIDGVDGVIGPRLAEFTQTDQFKDGLSVIGNATAGFRSRLERRSRQWLHMWNLPAGSDMTQLKRQVASLDHEVRRLRGDLAKQTGSSGSGRSASNVRPVRPRQARPSSRGAQNG